MLMLLFAGSLFLAPLNAQYQSDLITTSEGELEIFFIGHGTLMFTFNDLVIHIDPEMVADAAITLQPGILYPYHYGETDPQTLVELLKDKKDIEVRVRDLE